MEIVDRCPICNRADHEEFCSVHHAGHDLHYRVCRGCGVIFQSPRMQATDLQAFYTQGYRELYQHSEAPTEKDLVMQQSRARRTLDLVQDDIQSVSRHLDIGSSSGALLDAFRETYGSTPAGIEPGNEYRKYSDSRGIQTYASLDQLIAGSPAPFDLVSLMHVIEHLPDPRGLLEDLRENLLAPGAYLLVEVPNAYEHEALELAHLFAFTPASLRHLLELSGYKVEWIQTHGSFRSPVLKLFVTALARVSSRQPAAADFHSFPSLIKARRRYGQIKRQVLTRLLPDWTWQAPRELWDKP